jgi:two-component system OmpR family response regulator
MPVVCHGDALTVLVLDDEPAITKLVARMLRKFGYQVATANSAAEAEALAATDGVRALITDVLMPDENGPVFVQRLRDRGIHLPVLYMSGYYSDDTSGVYGLAERRHFVSKPFTQDELRTALENLLAEECLAA